MFTISGGTPPVPRARGAADVEETNRREIERIYREVGGRIWKALLAYSRDAEIASDAVAEAFAQALRRGDGIRDPERWVWRTAFRVAAGELMDRRRREHLREEESYEMPELARDLYSALAVLSPKQRAAVVLLDGFGYPALEAAAIVGSTPAAVRVHAMRARRKLRAHLAVEDGNA